MWVTQASIHQEGRLIVSQIILPTSKSDLKYKHMCCSSQNPKPTNKKKKWKHERKEKKKVLKQSASSQWKIILGEILYSVIKNKSKFVIKKQEISSIAQFYVTE